MPNYGNVPVAGTRHLYRSGRDGGSQPRDPARVRPSQTAVRLQADRPVAVRQAIYNCRKGGSVFVLGVFAGLVDKFPLGALMNKGLTVRGAQMHGHRYIPMILDRMAKNEIVTDHFATHVLPLQDGERGYELFKNKADGSVRTVAAPAGDVGRWRLTALLTIAAVDRSATTRPGPRAPSGGCPVRHRCSGSHQVPGRSRFQ